MEIPRYVERAFYVLREYSHEPNKGMTIALGAKENLTRAAMDMSVLRVNGQRILLPQMHEIFERYPDEPVLFSPEIYSVFRIMSNKDGHVDSLLAIDPHGYILPIDGFLHPSKKMIKSFAKQDPDLEKHRVYWGRRHWEAAGASLYEGISTLALSEQRGSVTTFCRGRVLRSLCYTPRK